jgi:hypothetical protein
MKTTINAIALAALVALVGCASYPVAPIPAAPGYVAEPLPPWAEGPAAYPPSGDAYEVAPTSAPAGEPARQELADGEWIEEGYVDTGPVPSDVGVGYAEPYAAPVDDAYAQGYVAEPASASSGWGWNVSVGVGGCWDWGCVGIRTGYPYTGYGVGFRYSSCWPSWGWVWSSCWSGCWGSCGSCSRCYRRPVHYCGSCGSSSCGGGCRKSAHRGSRGRGGRRGSHATPYTRTRGARGGGEATVRDGGSGGRRSANGAVPGVQRVRGGERALVPERVAGYRGRSGTTRSRDDLTSFYQRRRTPTTSQQVAGADFGRRGGRGTEARSGGRGTTGRGAPAARPTDRSRGRTTTIAPRGGVPYNVSGRSPRAATPTSRIAGAGRREPSRSRPVLSSPRGRPAPSSSSPSNVFGGIERTIGTVSSPSRSGGVRFTPSSRGRSAPRGGVRYSAPSGGGRNLMPARRSGDGSGGRATRGGGRGRGGRGR